MDNKVTITHRGETVEFYEYDETWRWGDEYSHASLKKVKEYIDRAHKEEIQGKTALLKSYWDGDSYVRVTITSQTEDGEYWVKRESGRREKVKAKNLLANCPFNEGIIAQLATIDSEAQQVKHQRAEVAKELVPFVSEAEVGDE